MNSHQVEIATGSRRRFLGMVVPAVVLAAGCRPDSSRPEDRSGPIRLGLFGALTGSEAGLGQYTEMGATLALEEINAAGGVLGRPLEMVREDNRTVAGESATAVKKLISRDRVVAIVDRQEGGLETLSAAGLELTSLFRLSEVAARSGSAAASCSPTA